MSTWSGSYGELHRTDDTRGKMAISGESRGSDCPRTGRGNAATAAMDKVMIDGRIVL